MRRRVLDAASWKCTKWGGYADEVDHVVPIRDGGDPWNPINLGAICWGCHIRKTTEENRSRRPPRPDVDAWQRLVDCLHPGSADCDAS